MATSSDRKVQKGKIAPLKHDDAAVKSSSRLVFDDERRAAQYDGYGDVESGGSGAQKAASPKAPAKDDRARVGLDKAAAIHEVQAADAGLDALFAADGQGGVTAPSKGISGSAAFGNWAGVPSLISFGASEGARAAGGGEVLEVEESLQLAPVIQRDGTGSLDTSSVGTTEVGMWLDNVLFDESTDASPWMSADVGRLMILGTGFPASDPSRTSWRVFDQYGQEFYSIVWENNTWRLKVHNTTGFFSREASGWGEDGAVLIRIEGYNSRTGERAVTEQSLNIVDLNEGIRGVNHYGSLNENESGDVYVGTLGPDDIDTYWTGAYTYSIDDPSNRFYIKNAEYQTAELWKREGSWFDHESVFRPTVNITIFDGQYTRTSSITISINDVNDLPNISLSRSGAVSEGSASLGVTITATDQDRDANGNPRDTVTLFTTDSRFVVENGVLKVANGGGADYETMHGTTVRVYAWDGVAEAQKFAVWKDVALNITDVNEAPYRVDLYGMEIDENVTGAAGGTFIGAFVVRDPDLPERESYTYTLVDPSGNFEVGPTGGLYLKEGKTLNHEDQEFYPVKIIVKDRGGTGYEYEQEYTLQVRDLNDKPTDITIDGETEITVPEFSSLSAALDAFDDDGDAITFTFEDGSLASGIFRINSATKRLELASGARLDYEALPANAKYHILRVKATDTRGGETIQELRINVTNVNEAPENLLLGGQTTHTVPENTGFSRQLTAFDPDGDPLRYEFVSNAPNGGNSNGTFRINTTTKMLELAPGKVLDYEALPANAKYHKVWVRAFDNFGGEVIREFTINVTDANDRPTNITMEGLTEVTVAEHTFFDRFVEAVDQDGDRVTFSFDATKPNGGDAGGMFRFNPDSGKLELAPGKTLDYETMGDNKFYKIWVKASDGRSGGTSVQEFTIRVSDANDAPTDITMEGAPWLTVSEDVAFARTLWANDQDRDDITFTFDTTKPNGGDYNGKFVIDPDTKQLKLAPGAKLNYEELPDGDRSYKIWVKASDDEAETVRELTIYVADANDAPTGIRFENPVVLNGSTGAGQPVVEAVAIDEDRNSDNVINNRYRFVNAEEGSNGLYSADGRFVIDAVSGAITTRRAMTADDVALGEVPILVQAYDGNLVGPEVEHIVLIRPANDPPEIVVVDGGTSHTVPDNGTLQPFENLRFQDSWEHEILTLRIVMSSVTNGYLDNVPAPEDFPNATIQYVRGQYVMIVTGSQADINQIAQNLVWRPEPRPNDPVGQGQITTFRVYLSDAVGTDELQVTLNSVTANRAPTDIQVTAKHADPNGVGHVTIGEGPVADGEIATLTAVDTNQGDTFVYDFADGGNPHGYFRIEGNKLVLNDVELDYDIENDPLLLPDTETVPGVTLKYFEVTVVAKDRSGGQGTLSSPPEIIRVYVNDVAGDTVNQAPDSITLDDLSIMENSNPGTVVGYLDASDPDGDTNFSFHTDDAKFEAVETVDGWAIQLRQDQTLDREEEASRTITVEVMDGRGGYYEQNFTIVIENDPAEIDDVVLSNSRVLEHADDGTIVGILSLPGFAAGDVTYDFDSSFAGGGNADGRFELGVDDQGNVVIGVTNGVKLDFEQARHHQIKIVATVAGVGAVSTELQIDLGNVLQEVVNDATGEGNRIHGGIGPDRFWGNDGNDTLVGGSGNDTLSGGEGEDVFVFHRFGTGNSDVLDDFDMNQDRIQLVKSNAFEALSVGELSVDAFWIGTEAHDADDRIIYDQASGRLYYDSDGTGGRAAFEVAQLNPGTALDYTRIFVTQYLI